MLLAIAEEAGKNHIQYQEPWPVDFLMYQQRNLQRGMIRGAGSRTYCFVVVNDILYNRSADQEYCKQFASRQALAAEGVENSVEPHYGIL